MIDLRKKRAYEALADVAIKMGNLAAQEKLKENASPEWDNVIISCMELVAAVADCGVCDGSPENEQGEGE